MAVIPSAWPSSWKPGAPSGPRSSRRGRREMRLSARPAPRPGWPAARGGGLGGAGDPAQGLDPLPAHATPDPVPRAGGTSEPDEIGADRREARQVLGAERSGEGGEQAGGPAVGDEGAECLVVEPVEQAPPILHRGV